MVNQPQDASGSPSIPVEDDSDKYSIGWKKEIVYILRAIMEKTGLVSAYFDHGQSFILTSIVGIVPDQDAVFFDLGANEAMNRKILDSGKIVFVTSHDKIKIQFTADHVKKTLFEGRDAFRIELPESLIKLQRREYYRVTTPIVNPLKCIIPMKENSKIEVNVVDISIGGIGVTLPLPDMALERGMTFHGCHLVLPDIGRVEGTLEVRNLFDVTLKSGLKSKRAGFQFIDLPANVQTMIQRYIIKVERDRRAKDLDWQ